MGASTEDLEPLFDYSRVQPLNIISLDDDDSDTSPGPLLKKRKKPDPAGKRGDDDVEVIKVVACEDEDWLLPPPKVSSDGKSKLSEDSTMKALRLQKQELLSFAESAKHMMEEAEESIKKDLNGSLEAEAEAVAEELPKPACERAKIVISIQDKDVLKQFRVYMDDKFERLFKMYSDRVKHDEQSLVFCFDGDKVSPNETPASLGMEDDDIIEVHMKKC